MMRMRVLQMLLAACIQVTSAMLQAPLLMLLAACIQVASARLRAPAELQSKELPAAFVFTCSGMDPISFEERTSDVGTRRGNRRSGAARVGVHRNMSDIMLAGRKEHLSNNWTLSSWIEYLKEGHFEPFPALLPTSREQLCLVSVCSLLNETQPDSTSVDVAALVDEETPRSVLDAYHANRVQVIDMSDALFPSYFNRNDESVQARTTTSWTPRQERQIPRNSTVADAIRLGAPHYSERPDVFYKLWLWNMTQYSKIFFLDPDTLTVGNATAHHMARYAPFAARLYRPISIQGAMYSLRPDRATFDAMYQSWSAGEHPHVALKRSSAGAIYKGDDDQNFLSFYINTKKALPEPMHEIDRCDNDKFGFFLARCPPPVVYHKWPVWEAERIDVLWEAAQAGRCRANPRLQNWRPQSQIRLTSETGQ